MKPIRALMWCPKCGLQHIDEGEWATREHRTHRCVGVDGCGHEWRPSEASTIGVKALGSISVFVGNLKPGYIITDEPIVLERK